MFGDCEMQYEECLGEGEFLVYRRRPSDPTELVCIAYVCTNCVDEADVCKNSDEIDAVFQRPLGGVYSTHHVAVVDGSVIETFLEEGRGSKHGLMWVTS